MLFVKIKKIIFLIFILLVSTSLFAEVDELQSELLSNYFMPFRWDAVSDKEYWAKGNKPIYDLKSNAYKIKLKPGEFSIVRVPRGENMLLHSYNEQSDAKNFSFSLSQGTGLYIESFFKCVDQKGNYITEIFSESATLARIENSSNQIIEMSLFVSKQSRLGELSPYRDILFLAEKTVLLNRGNEAGLQMFQSMKEGCPTDLKVVGPMRLAIESHFSYSDNEGSLFQNWEIDAALDSKFLKCLKYQSTMENVFSIHINGKKEVVSKREVAYLDIPDGEHMLRLKSNAPLYVRVLSQACQNFLFKSDAPSGYGKEIGDKRLEKIERRGLQVALDNRFREGAVLGASLMQDAALKRKDYLEMRNSYDNLVDYNTFYRHLVPVQMGKNQVVAYHTFVLRKLLEIGVSREPYYSSERFLREYLARLGNASFLHVPYRNTEQQDSSLLYRLTPSPSDSWLRVLVNLKPESLGQSFWMQLDDQKPILFNISDLKALDKSYYATSAGEAALEILEKQTEVLGDASLKEPLSFKTIMSDAIEAGAFEIPISASVETVKIWKTDPKDCVLEVALEQRASKPSQLLEHRYLALIQSHDKLTLKHKLLTLLEGYPHSLNNNDELTNYWIPLIRLLNTEYKLYVNGIVKPNVLSETQEQLNETELIKLNASLQTELVAKDWLNAFETASKIANGTNGKVQAETKLLQSDILKNLGENYLAEQILRAQFINDPRTEFREKTLGKLMKYYQSSTNKIAKQTFYAAAFKIYPTTEVLQALVETLADNGSYDLAMMLALLLEDPKQPVSTMLKMAYQLGWWGVMDTFINRLDNDQQYYWLALKGRIFNEYTNVLANFKKSNTVEPTTLRIRPDLIASHAGGELIYSVDRNLYTQTYKATKKTPLKLKLIGPLRLHLEVRPLHVKNNSNAIDGWIEVRSKNKLWVTSINNNMPSEEVILIDNTKEVAGRRVISEIFLEKGFHELEITGGDTSIVTSVEAVGIENPAEEFPPVSEIVSQEAVWLDDGNVEPFLNVLTGTQAEDVVRRITQLLWLSEKKPNRYSEALAFSLSLANQYPWNAELEPLINRFSQNSIWTPVSTTNNGGIRTVGAEGWQFMDPNLRVRKALLPAFGLDEEVIFGNNHIILSLVNPEPTTLQLEFEMADLLNLSPQNLTVNYQLDKEEAKNLQLTPKTFKTVLNVAVPVGEHALRIGLQNPLTGQLLRVRISDKQEKKIVQKLEMSYEISTQSEPIVYEITAPAWIKIDEWRNGKIITSYKYIASSAGAFKLFPKEGQKEALYRLSVRTGVGGKANSLTRRLTYKIDPVPVAKNTDGYYKPKVPLHYQQCNPLTIHNSTWSLGGLYNERIDIEEQTLQQSIERYFELNSAYRHYAEDIKTYLNTGLLGRRRQKGGNTFGLSEQISYHPYLSPWSFDLEAYGFMQRPENTKTEWSALFRGIMTQKRDINPKAYHLPTLALFKHLMSLNTIEARLYPAGSLDQDIYTNYKSLHRFGIEISDTFVYRPKMDTLFLLKMGAISREDYRIFTPDRAVVSFGLKQLIGDYELNADYRYQRFYKDKNLQIPFARKKSFIRRAVGLDLSKKHWFSDHLVEFKLGAQRQVDFKKSIFSLLFIYHFTHNRYYSDFSPKETEFLNISYPQTQQWNDFRE